MSYEARVHADLRIDPGAVTDLDADLQDVLAATADGPSPDPAADAAVAAAADTAAADGRVAPDETAAARRLLAGAVAALAACWDPDGREVHVGGQAGMLRVWVSGFASLDGRLDDLLHRLRPAAAAGRVEFTGEDGDRWVETLGATVPVQVCDVEVPAGKVLVCVDEHVADLLDAGPVGLVVGDLTVGQIVAGDLV